MAKPIRKPLIASGVIRHEEREHLAYVLRVRKALRIGHGGSMRVEEEEGE